jgi:hypothetical protein
MSDPQSDRNELCSSETKRKVSRRRDASLMFHGSMAGYTCIKHAQDGIETDK